MDILEQYFICDIHQILIWHISCHIYFKPRFQLTDIPLSLFIFIIILFHSHICSFEIDSCKHMWTVQGVSDSCSFPWVSLNLGTRVRLVLFSAMWFISLLFSCPSLASLTPSCYHTRLLGHTNGTACVIQLVVPCLAWHYNLWQIFSIYHHNTFLPAVTLLSQFTLHQVMTHLFSLFSHNTLITCIISFWYLLWVFTLPINATRTLCIWHQHDIIW